MTNEYDQRLYTLQITENSLLRQY